MSIAVSHGGGQTIVQTDVAENEVLFGTVDGVVILRRETESWSQVSRSLNGKHIHALVFEPQSGTWFAGAQHGGVYASTDGGRTWSERVVGLSELNVYSLSCASIDGTVRLFCGTEPAKLFISDDLGLTWEEKPHLAQQKNEKWSFPAPPHVPHVKHINFSPSDPKTVFASIEVGALLKSVDGGDTWAEVEGMYEDVHRCIISPDSGSMYVTGGMGLWASHDSGDSWQNVFGRGSESGGYPDQLVFKPSDPTYMILSAGQKSPGNWGPDGTAANRFSRSTDAGRTWEILTLGLEDKFKHNVEAMTLNESSSGTQIFAATTGGEVFWSSDAGASWSIVGSTPPVSKGGHYKPLVTGEPVD